MLLELLAGVLGLLLLVGPIRLVYDMTVPVPKYRTGSFADFRSFVLTCLTVYGGAAGGILCDWWYRARQRQPGRAFAVFRAGFIGAIVAVGVALAIASLEKGPGNLWGLIVILGAVFGAIVAAGTALLWYALHGPHTT